MGKLAFGVASLALVLFACGSDDANAPTVGPSSGIDPGGEAGPPRTLADLTAVERKKLCDWTANRGGGYGKAQVCDGGLVVRSVSDQNTCISQYLGACSTVTVTEWEKCRNVEVASPCTLPLYTAPECLNVRRCIGLTDGGPPPEPGDGG
jgi:hypothetical protein